MTARLDFTQAQLRRNIAAAQKAGLRVVGIRPDGTIIVDNGDGPHPLAQASGGDGQSSGLSEWEDLEV